MASSGWRRVLGRVLDVAMRQSARELTRRRDGGTRRTLRTTTASRRPDTATPPSPPTGRAATEHTGPVPMDYRPRDDGRPDPGEIVWAWVPFEEGDGRGKDRPVLVVGRDGDALLALMLSSKDHDLDAADEARHGRHWVDVGTGPWDRQGRPSEVRVDRVLRIDPAQVRREGATLGRARFDEVAAAVRQHRS